MIPFSCILFDFEGVLFNPSRIMKKAYEEAFDKCGESIPSDVSLTEHLAFSPKVTLRKLQAKNSSLILKEYEKKYLILSNIPSYIVLYDNVLSTLRMLREKGTKIGVVTSQKKERFLAIATKSNILPLLDVAITPSDCGLSRLKPNPFGIELALEKLGKAKTNSAFVGDSPEDIIAAKRANVFSIAAAWGLYPESALLSLEPGYLCRKIEDILHMEIDIN